MGPLVGGAVQSRIGYQAMCGTVALTCGAYGALIQLGVDAKTANSTPIGIETADAPTEPYRIMTSEEYDSYGSTQVEGFFQEDLPQDNIAKPMVVYDSSDWDSNAPLLSAQPHANFIEATV